MKIHLILLRLVLSLPLMGADKNPLLPKEESAKAIEAAIRKSLKKPKGELTQADYEKVSELRLERSGVTDEGLKEEAKLKPLSELYLTGPKITDNGLLGGAQVTAALQALLERHQDNRRGSEGSGQAHSNQGAWLG